MWSVVRFFENPATFSEIADLKNDLSPIFELQSQFK